jgi:hypothetical protein
MEIVHKITNHCIWEGEQYPVWVWKDQSLVMNDMWHNLDTGCKEDKVIQDTSHLVQAIYRREILCKCLNFPLLCEYSIYVQNRI